MSTPLCQRLLAACPLLLLFSIASSTAHAEVDLSGSWGQKIHEDFEERVRGPSIGDYTGLPINRAARLRAESWSDEYWSVPEHQCEAAPADYAPHGPGSMRVWSEVDPRTEQLIAWHVVYLWHTPHRTIWMDGRPHPPEGTQHTWMGFSTGKWVGDTLVVTTTHLKEGWIRRNGVPRSDRGSLTEYWLRNGDYLTVVSAVEDPVYLTAPLVRTATWALTLGYKIGGYACSPKMESDLPRGFVAHQLPGENAALQEFAAKRKLSAQAAGGGEETLYPEYGRKLASLPASAASQERRRSKAAASAALTKEDRHDIRVLPVRENVLVLMSPVGNTTVQTGDDGVLIVDTQSADLSQATLDAIKRLSAKPIRYLINTSADLDKTGGNEKISGAGRSIGPEAAFFDTEAEGASIYAHENVLQEMSASKNGKSARDTGAWPTDVYFTAETEIHFNGEVVELLHEPAAHSNGDSVVHFRRADVVSTGDVFLTTGYPHFDVDEGGSIDGVIEALNRIIDITVPVRGQEGGTLVIPGRGRICDEYDVVAYRDMVTIIRDRIRSMMKKGLTLEQIQAARPTEAYDGRYGTEQGALTTKHFVESVYRSLASAAGA